MAKLVNTYHCRVGVAVGPMVDRMVSKIEETGRVAWRHAAAAIRA
jgi:hypothetical protein